MGMAQGWLRYCVNTNIAEAVSVPVVASGEQVILSI